jgi:hypothetical protein
MPQQPLRLREIAAPGLQLAEHSDCVGGPWVILAERRFRDRDAALHDSRSFIVVLAAASYRVG